MRCIQASLMALPPSVSELPCWTRNQAVTVNSRITWAGDNFIFIDQTLFLRDQHTVLDIYIHRVTNCLANKNQDYAISRDDVYIWLWKDLMESWENIRSKRDRDSKKTSVEDIHSNPIMLKGFGAWVSRMTLHEPQMWVGVSITNVAMSCSPEVSEDRKIYTTAHFSRYGIVFEFFLLLVVLFGQANNYPNWL